MSIVKKLGDIEKKINAYGNQINRITELLEKNQEFLKVLLANQLLDEMDVQSLTVKNKELKANTDKNLPDNEPNGKRGLYSPENFIDRGGYIELRKPIGNINAIETKCGIDDWYNACFYAEKLHYGGFHDWRLPTVDELKALVLIRSACKLEDGSCMFWSCEELLTGDSSRAFFNIGNQVFECDNTNRLQVCCVR